MGIITIWALENSYFRLHSFFVCTRKIIEDWRNHEIVCVTELKLQPTILSLPRYRTQIGVKFDSFIHFKLRKKLLMIFFSNFIREQHEDLLKQIIEIYQIHFNARSIYLNVLIIYKLSWMRIHRKKKEKN